MPCRSDYMESTHTEVQLSRVACLLDELSGKEWSGNDWDGYHPRVYRQRVDGDALTRELCERLQQVDASKYSLEMQMWWRDHQAADKKRLQQELNERKTQAEREAALNKLTPYERQILGLDK